MIENELYRYLTSTLSTAVTAIISSRFYIGQIPQTVTYPCVVMYLISRTDGHLYDIPIERFQFSCYGNSYSSAKSISEAIIGSLKRLQGKMFLGSTITTSTYTIFKTLYDNLTYLYDDSVYKHVSILDMVIQYKV